ncbi:PAS domain S-box-containing protein [Dyella jiangningensis]|uniref:PAS domain S-box protein n=1 Tax=Dyella sp. AtDHG13 TaxID=1938897 RepID=UPI00087F15D8|nr:PAS domain S-box protein [Dyella sp. AtDHG13]PXV52377.1 PAS domain S-box-containing protein [Dyella sp. AtDHG13]SDL39262.1 PAS domain S-box-containing protein [Dyella jiangningensis]
MTLPPSSAGNAALFRALFDTAPDAMIVVDQDGRIVLANPQAERMFGYGPHELHGLPVETLLPERVRHAHQSHRSSYMANPRVRPMGAGYELTGVRRTGQSFPVEIGLSPIATDGDALYAASIRDISETQRARQALVRARYDAAVGQVSRLLLESPSYEKAVDNMPSLVASTLKAAAVAIFFRDAHARAWNCRGASGIEPALQRALCRELSDAGWAGTDMRLEFDGSNSPPPDGFERVRELLIDARFMGAALAPLPDRYEPMGLLLVLSRERDGFDHDKMHFLQSVANILAAAAQRSRSEEQLAHAQRLDAIGQLTGGIAHDFNNLLTIISGNLQLLAANPPDDALSLEAMESAARAADRCAVLTSKLLLFASRRHLKPQAVQPARLLSDLHEMLSRALGERIAIHMECPDGLPAIDVDPSEFDTALVNLAVNARDSMPRGGRLDITVRLESADEPSSTGYIVFHVQDTGMGMAPEVLAHALEPFFTTKEAGKGSGLGLSMVYGFVKQSGGRMSIDSQLGYGTQVELWFPVATEMPLARPEVDVVAPRVGSGTILVVEDEPEVRRIALAFLRSLGYATLEAEGAEQAFTLLREHADIDLLFSDIVLGGGMTGVELAESARRLWPRLPVLLTSGYERRAPDVKEAALKQFSLLPKPYRKEDLADAVYQAIHGDRRHPPGH